LGLRSPGLSPSPSLDPSPSVDPLSIPLELSPHDFLLNETPVSEPWSELLALFVPLPDDPPAFVFPPITEVGRIESYNKNKLIIKLPLSKTYTTKLKSNQTKKQNNNDDKNYLFLIQIWLVLIVIFKGNIEIPNDVSQIIVKFESNGILVPFQLSDRH
jgi:hypothetical protein